MQQGTISGWGIPQNPQKALIMIHGRGGSAQDIMSLSRYLKVDDYLLLGPQAAAHTVSAFFMAPGR